MSDIHGTLSYIHCVPEGQNATDKCLFIHGLDLAPQKLFQFLPKVFYRVQVRRFRRCLPPVDLSLCQEPLCMFRCVFRVIVLHEAMMIRKHVLKKWQKCAVKDACVQRSIHFSFKYTYSTPPSKADPCPDVNFHRMFGPATVKQNFKVLMCFIWNTCALFAMVKLFIVGLELTLVCFLVALPTFGSRIAGGFQAAPSIHLSK